jgi:polyhydroxyalkanoate synthesis regulator phasin
MSEAKTGKPIDPLDPWREMRDTYMNAWSKTMIEAVNTDAYAETTGAMLDTYLAASGPFREAVEKAMTETLQQLSMPSRQDVTSIAERLTNLEMRLDDMDAALQRIERLLSRPPAGAAAASAG